MTMQSSKTTDKIIALEAIMSKMPLERIKVFDLVWEEVDYIAVPFVHAEFYETEKEKNDIEKDAEDSE